MLTRRRFLTSFAAGILALLAACGEAIRSRTASPSPTARVTPLPTTPPTPAPSASAAPTEPTLREVIAGLLLVGFRGLTPAEAAPTLRLLGEERLGGVILFSVDQPTGGPRNVESPEQVAGLVGALQEAAGGSLIVAVDQEGGRVARLGPAHGFPATRSAAELGAGDPARTRAAAAEMAVTLREAGVTLNLAPVLDLALNPENGIIAGLERSFGADPEAVAAHAAAFVEAHHAAGVRCAVKHFPGQGSAGGDTHLGVVDVTDAWAEVELEPFRALIGAGLPDAVMSAHIHNAALDPDHPATLSQATLGDLLRGRLGWQGPIVSDDLQMRALADAYGPDEVVELALRAGVDLLLVANQVTYDPDVVPRTIGVVERLVADGRVSDARLRASWRRVAALRPGG